MIGVTFGILAAFATQTLDDMLAATLDILIAFPTLLLAMLIVASSDGASLSTAILAIGIAASAIVARLTRILAKRVLAMDYVTASRISGTSWLGVVRIHVLPNIWPTLIVNFALQFGLAVIAEASLSYLGLGAPPPNASWGRLLQEAQASVYTAPFGAIAPDWHWFRSSSGLTFCRWLARCSRPNAEEATMSPLLNVENLAIETAGRVLVSDVSFRLSRANALG